jgi:hypothetical protein
MLSIKRHWQGINFKATFEDVLVQAPDSDAFENAPGWQLFAGRASACPAFHRSIRVHSRQFAAKKVFGLAD